MSFSRLRLFESISTDFQETSNLDRDRVTLRKREAYFQIALNLFIDKR